MAKPKWKIIYEHLEQGYTLKLTPFGQYALCHPKGGISHPDIPRATINALEDRELIVPIAWRAKSVKNAPVPIKGVIIKVNSKARSVEMKTK